MPNVSLEPGDKDLSEQDLIAATDDGVLIKGDGSYSIDHQRYNFQFSGQTFWEVKNGKVTTQLRDLAYQSNTPEFWKSCDMLESSKCLGLVPATTASRVCGCCASCGAVTDTTRGT